MQFIKPTDFPRAVVALPLFSDLVPLQPYLPLLIKRYSSPPLKLLLWHNGVSTVRCSYVLA